jgi:hypothetical protein
MSWKSAFQPNTGNFNQQQTFPYFRGRENFNPLASILSGSQQTQFRQAAPSETYEGLPAAAPPAPTAPSLRGAGPSTSIFASLANVSSSDAILIGLGLLLLSQNIAMFIMIYKLLKAGL